MLCNECHNNINKVVSQLSGEEMIKYTYVELSKDPIYQDKLMILTHLKSKCKVCGDNYCYLIKSCYV